MSKSPIHLDADVAIKALEDHKTQMFGLVNDPKFRDFWTMMGGTTEQLDSAKVELEKRKSR
jgi:hypothetical protein